MKYSLLIALSVLVLNGCANSPLKKSIESRVNEDTTQIDALLADSRQAKINPISEKVNAPWIAGKSFTVRETKILPEVFNKKVTIRPSTMVSLAYVAEQLKLVSGLNIEIRPDVFLRPEQFAPRSRQSAGGAGQSVLSATPQPPVTSNTAFNPSMPMGQPLNQSQQLRRYDDVNNMPVDFRDTPLRDVLNALAARLGIDWDWADGRISLYRTLTKTFIVKRAPGSASQQNSSLGIGISSSPSSSGGGSSGGSGGQGASGGINISNTAKFDPWVSFEAKVNALLTPMGTAVVSQETGTVTVQDLKQVVDQVALLVEQENKVALKQIEVDIRIISVATNRAQDYGIDMTGVYNRMVQTASRYGVSLSSPSSIVPSNAGTLSYSISSGHSAAAGSALLVKALATYGQVRNSNHHVFSTMNNITGSKSLIDQTSYVASTTPVPATVAGAVGGTPGIQPGIVTTGFQMSMTPTVVDDQFVIVKLGVIISGVASENGK